MTRNPKSAVEPDTEALIERLATESDPSVIAAAIVDHLRKIEVSRSRMPFHLDSRAQAAVLADLPTSVAQEAGEFYQNAGGGDRSWKKSACMAEAWQHVLRPYLIGLRDQHASQARPQSEEVRP